MTPEQIHACKTSWARVEPIADTAASLFYNNLFTADPSLKHLFKGDMQAQGKKLMEMIGAAVRMLDRLDELVPIVEAMGRRHLAYGVEDAHYDTVGSALIETLQTGLGDDFTDDVRDAWLAAYTILASTMIAAAHREASA